MKLRKQIRGYEGLYEIRSDGAIISMPREKRLPNGKLCQSKERVMSPARIGEDVPEEPKDFWFIDPEILIACESTDPLLCDKKVAIETMKQIGNYFDTREEAEKAVEKLKAFKRLKDKGFRFEGYDSGHNSNKELCGQAYFKAGNFWFDIKTDLDLLFCPEGD